MNTHSNLPIDSRLASSQVPTMTMGVKSSLAWARTTWPAESRARRVVQVEASLQCIRRCMKSCALMQVVVDASSVAAAIGCYVCCRRKK